MIDRHDARRIECGRRAAFIFIAPEIIEIEPVVGCMAGVMLQPGGVTFDEREHGLGALLARHGDAVAETLEGQVVAVATPVQAEGQHHRHLQGGGDQPRRGRERRIAAQERHLQCRLAGTRAIDQQRDQGALVGGLLDRHGDGWTILAGIDHPGGDFGIQGIQHLGHGRVVGLVQDHPDLVVGTLLGEHAHDFETAQVRAEQQHALATVEHGMQFRQAGDAHVETAEASAEQEYPVEDGRGKSVEVACHRPQSHRMAQRARQVSTRGATLGAAHQQEVQGDRIQQDAAERAPAMAGDAADQPDRETAATFRTLLPVGAHGRRALTLRPQPLRPAAWRRLHHWPAVLRHAARGNAIVATALAVAPTRPGRAATAAGT
jgi:hypothetical protein